MLSPTVITTFPAMILFTPYAGASWQFGDGETWHITPSTAIRGLFHSVWANELSWQGGLGFGWKSLDLTISYARGLVFPAPAVLQGLLADPALYQATDLKGIAPEKIDHIEAGINFAPQPGNLFSYTLDASYFFNDGRNRLIMVSQIPGNASTVSSYRLHGLEMAAGFHLSPGRMFAHTIEIFTGGTWYIDISATGEDGTIVKNMPFTPSFSLSAGFRWTFLEHFNLSGDFNYLHDFYTGILGLSSGFTMPSEENRLKDVYLLNLRIGYNFSRESWRLAHSELFFAVNNVLHYQYEYFTGYIMPGITYTIGFSFKLK